MAGSSIWGMSGRPRDGTAGSEGRPLAWAHTRKHVISGLNAEILQGDTAITATKHAASLHNCLSDYVRTLSTQSGRYESGTIEGIPVPWQMELVRKRCPARACACSGRAAGACCLPEVSVPASQAQYPSDASLHCIDECK